MMTAETLKSFIALPPPGSTFNRSRRNVCLITICLSTIFSLICLTLVGFLIYNSSRVNYLEEEVEALRKVVDSMQKRLGLDYLDDLNEFEEAYSKDLLDDAQQGGLLDMFDEDDDDFEIDDNGSGSSYEFDSENYDDDDGLTASDDMVYDDALKFSDSHRRKQRSIPDNSDAYDKSESDDSSKEYLDTIEQALGSIQRDSSIHNDRKEQLERQRRRGRKYLKKHPYNRWKVHHKKDTYELSEPQMRIVKKRSNNRLLKSGDHMARTRAIHSPPHLISLHYILNGTLSHHNYHPYHEANPRLSHDGDVYVGHLQPWVKGLGMDKTFDIENGVVRILESGVYYIYAQVFYHNPMDRNGFFVYHNSHAFLQCALTVPANAVKGNTCFTSGVTHLEKDDTVHMRDLFKDRAVTLRGPKSFFGMIKLSDTNSKY